MGEHGLDKVEACPLTTPVHAHQTKTVLDACRQRNPNQVAFLAVLEEINAAALADAEQLLADTQALATRTLAQYHELVQEATAALPQRWSQPGADEARCWRLSPSCSACKLCHHVLLPHCS